MARAEGRRLLNWKSRSGVPVAKKLVILMQYMNERSDQAVLQFSFDEILIG